MALGPIMKSLLKESIQNLPEDYARKTGAGAIADLAKKGVKAEEIEFSKIGETIPEGRVTKQDILDYLKNKPASSTAVAAPKAAAVPAAPTAPPVTSSAGDEIMEMDRMRKLIADHMVMSKQVSPHVTSVVEADVTELVLWRNKNKT